MLAACCSLGMLIALVPVLFVIAVAPRQFAFGNFTYPTLNTAFRDAVGYRKSMTAWGKLLYLLRDIMLQPATLIGTGALLATIVLARRRWRLVPNEFRLETQLLTLLSL